MPKWINQYELDVYRPHLIVGKAERCDQNFE